MTQQADIPRIYLYRRIVQAKLFIDQHYAGMIDLDDIAGEASFSKFHFIRLFKSIYGKTPHQHLIAVRVEQAKQLLKTSMPVNEVCYAVGFDSPASFSLLFKRIVHSSPSAWQQGELRKQAEMKNIPSKYIPNCFIQQNGWAQLAQAIK
jgi:AraC-like DNA-binding protein